MAKRDDPQFRIRLPADLKKKIEESAKAAGRSLNTEIEKRLEHTFLKHYPSPPRNRGAYLKTIDDTKKSIERWNGIIQNIPESFGEIERAIALYELTKELEKLDKLHEYLKEYDERQEFLKTFYNEDE